MEIFASYDNVLHIERASEMIGISVSLMRQLVAKKAIPASRIGKRLIFLKEHLIIYFIFHWNKKIAEVNSLYER